jgi:hypothetical protein
MNLLRRLLGICVVGVMFGAVVVIDRQNDGTNVGATSALVPLAGFPQAVSGTRISTSWFCPGAAAGDGITGAFVVIANPGDVEIVASLRLLTDSAGPIENVTVEPRSQKKIDILRGKTVGVVAPIVEIIGSTGSVEQELLYAAGDVTAQCVSQTSSRWYFADGFTLEGTSQRLVLINPFPESAVVNVAYTTRDGKRTPSALQGLIIAPRSLKSLSLADVGAANESRIAVEAIATTGQIIASRSQHYLGGGRLGYSTSVGVPEALSEWWFASGRTGELVNEELVVFNPTDVDAQVNVAFFGEGITNDIAIDEIDGPALPSQVVDIPAGAVIGIKTDNFADLPKGDHAMVVSTLNDARVVVEHVLSQRTATSTFTAITNGIPSGLLTPKWRIPSGLAKGARNALSVLNVTAVDGTYTVFTIGPGGQVGLRGLIDVPLPAASLTFLDVPEGASDGEVVIQATVDIAVQRRILRGAGLVGFGIVSALPVRTR